MNCDLRYDKKENKKNGNSSGSSNSPKSGRWERWAAGLFTFLLASVFAWRVSALRSQGWQGVISGNTKSNWEQMSGNGGKFWRESPDERTRPGKTTRTAAGVVYGKYWIYLYSGADDAQI